ncbi:MAG: hypothetical protein MJB57_17275 [Gemmatimonadetes bacterium]|nr:hypothetical protein [Gemmatimonadota bacterium]
MSSTHALGARRISTVRDPDMWLVSPGYDLVFVIFSAALLAFPHIARSLVPSDVFVDLVVTMLIGGPHLFATYTMTVMEPEFRERYPRYARGALLLPVLIVSAAIWNLTLLVTVFFFWASVHVIHQAAFIADAYRFKDPRGWQKTSTIVDYGLLMTSLYPVATGKLIRSEFQTGGRTLLFPDFLRLEIVADLAWVAFLFFATAFIWKSIWEIREGRLHIPKTLHMTLAAALFFVTPMLPNLDVAFQGLNTWHSFQYLAVVLYLNRLREKKGYIRSEVVRRVSRRGWSLYGMCLAFTLGAGALFLALLGVVVGFGWFETGEAMGMIGYGTVFADQHYFAFYSVVLSFLLIHYYFDHFIFLHADKRITPQFEGR